MADKNKDLGELLTLRQEICNQRGFVRQMQRDGFGLNEELIKCLNCQANKEYAETVGCRFYSADGENNKVQEAENPQRFVSMRCLSCNEEQSFVFVSSTSQGLLYRCLKYGCENEQFYNEEKEKER